VGERLFATRLPECDLLEGKTGPKLFLECGVGRKTKGNWKIVNGMLRIPGKKGMKPSVVRKKVKNIPSDSLIEVYVSKIRLEHDSFEVCLNREDALSRYKEQKVSASKFTPGQLLSGVVRDVLPYGVFVDIGASRKGLIHITNVAKSRDCYINKEEGLKSAGLARGSHVRVVVLNNEKKRLEFDLYEAEKAPIAEESLDETAIGFSEGDEEALAWGAYNDERTDEISAEEADMWAAYAAYENSAEDEENDYYDEDEEIEDALGIGSY
jgi:predicted RNA-binding protein with RPS1 domain